MYGGQAIKLRSLSVRPQCNLKFATRFLANIIDVFTKCQFWVVRQTYTENPEIIR